MQDFRRLCAHKGHMIRPPELTRPWLQHGDENNGRDILTVMTRATAFLSNSENVALEKTRVISVKAAKLLTGSRQNNVTTGSGRGGGGGNGATRCNSAAHKNKLTATKTLPSRISGFGPLQQTTVHSLCNEVKSCTGQWACRNWSGNQKEKL